MADVDHTRAARRRALAVLVGMALAATACSGGGGSGSDPLAGENFASPAGEKLLQFAGAGGKLRIGATFTLPDNAKDPVPAVLIVPGPGLTNRDGLTVGAPIDNLYKDLSKAFTTAGMATLRYDHRGVGASTLEAGAAATWDDMVTDAQEALKFLGQRGEVDGSRLAVVGHDLGGTIALKLAATDTRVRSVALVGAPGRPLVDVWADQFRSLNGQESSDAFRALVAGLVATGSYPPRDSMRPEYQTALPSGQDALYRGLFSADPLADAPAVKAPVLIALGAKSTSVSTDDATRIGQALGGASEVVVAPDANVTLQTQKPPRPPAPFDPSDMSAHGGGAPVPDAPRDQPTVARIASFLASSLGARPA